MSAVSRCSPWTSRFSTSWEVVGNADSQPPPAQPVRTSVGGLSPHGMLMTAELQRGCRAPEGLPCPRMPVKE